MKSERWTFGPYLHVDDARTAIEWYENVFGATVRERYQMEDGRIGHAELDLHGNVLCLADLRTGVPKPKRYDEVPITLYAVVPNVDEVFEAAIAAGAEVERALENQTYGHRNGGFVDPFGHVWYVSTPIPAAR